MTNLLLDAMSIQTFTENGATANNTSGAGALLDLFAQCGSLRSRIKDIDYKFKAAYEENPLLAAKLAFYTRDIRRGLGERDAARAMFRVIADEHPEVMKKNLHLLAEYGRYDDLISLLDTAVKEDVVMLIRDQLKEDTENMQKGESVSLLAKWMPSVNTSSYKSRKKAKQLAMLLNMSEREYRKVLSALRAYLNVTEVRMTEKNYDCIRYEAVPSKAMNLYRNAFARNDKERFEQYMQSVQNGEASINASAVFPYDIAEKYTQLLLHGYIDQPDEDPVIEAQWKALPDYIEGENNFLIMVDVSGSMYGRPIAVSVGLGIYFAERNRGAFKDTFMTFSEKPKLIKIAGDSLAEKVFDVFSSGTGYNTDLEAAFERVLITAVTNHIPQSEMPESVIVISDGEIDYLSRQTNWTFMDEMKERFESAGYRLPNLVLWNVDSRHNIFHASGKAENVQFCSGSSPAVFKSLIKSVGMTPYDFMLSVLDDPRYDPVRI